MRGTNSKTDLTSMPNIGEEIARLLTAAGICSARELRQVGALAAAARIKE